MRGAAPWYRHLYVQVLVAIVLGVLVGHFAPATGEALKPLGDAFIKLVKMIIAPVIFLTIVTGIAGHARPCRGRARRGQGVRLFPVLLDPRADRRADRRQCRPARRRAEHRSGDASMPAKVADYADKAHDTTLTGFLLDIIPDTLVSALTAGNILQTLLVAILFGVALALVGERGERLLGALEQICRWSCSSWSRIVMKLAPIGAFGAMAFTIGKYGIGTLANLAGLVATFYLTSPVVRARRARPRRARSPASRSSS